MFHTERMQKIRIVGLHSEKERVVRELHKLGIIDMRKSKLEMEDDKPAEILPQVSELIVRYDSAKVILENYMKKGGAKQQLHEKEAQPKTAALLQLSHRFEAVNEIIALEERQADLANEIARIDAEKNTVLPFLGLGIDFSKLKSEVLAFAAYKLSPKARKVADKEIAELGRKYEVIENKSKKGCVLFIAYAKEDTPALAKLEHFSGVHKLDMSGPYFDSTAEKIVDRLEQQKKNAEAERNDSITKLEKHARDDYQKIVGTLEMLSVEAERASASIGFKRTNSTFVIEGWVEKGRIDEISAKLDALTSGKFELEEIKSDELAPTLIRRSKFLQPFDKMVEFFSLPRSDELDPTIVFVLFFPIFYGLMVSDVGYGLISFVFAYFIARISDPDDILYNAAKIWEISSVAVIFFGFLSNQYFGLQLNHYFTSFVGFDWLKDPPTILVATVVFGIIQVIIGLIFSFVNNYHHGHKKIAVSKITSIILIVAGTLAIGGSLFHAFDASTTQVSTDLAVVSLLLTLAMSGTEATEIFSLISHPLSYARIMGFGLASVILAILIDRGFTPSLAGGIPAFVLTLIIFILLHFVNMILGTFEGLVQGVRLNFVEFFSKFYAGGGVKFRPFAFKRRYTKEV